MLGVMTFEGSEPGVKVIVKQVPGGLLQIEAQGGGTVTVDTARCFAGALVGAADALAETRPMGHIWTGQRGHYGCTVCGLERHVDDWPDAGVCPLRR